MKKKTPHSLIYFDNAATSFPKPPEVAAETARCMSYCGNPGRGSHKLALAASRKIYAARESLADLLNTEPERVCFTYNATHALNQAIKGVLRPGDHAVISDMEHNSVYRPICALSEESAGASMFETGGPDGAVMSALESSLPENTRALICTHVSNVCGRVLPVDKIGALCRRHNIVFILDASQSAGHIPIDMAAIDADILCLPGHKGLLGPQGVGALVFSRASKISPDKLATIIEGGSGINSLDVGMPELTPERFEAGTANTTGIAGLLAGINVVKRTGIEKIAEHERILGERLYEMLGNTPGVKLHSTAAPVLSFNIAGMDAARVGDALDKTGICVRTGYHCAPLAHHALNSPPGGTVRVSVGLYNTLDEINILWRVLRGIIKNGARS